MNLHPNGRFLFAWHTVYVVAALFAAIEVSLELVFHTHRPPWFRAIDLIVSFYFLVDIALCFKTPFFHHGQLVNNQDSIRSRYLKGSFIFDFIASIPFEYLWLAIAADSSSLVGFVLFCIVMIFRIIRALKVLTIFKRQSDLLEKPITVSILQYAIISITIAHSIACGWILIQGIDPQADLVTNYNIALYWTITTLTTVGYGDISPTENLGRIYTMFVMILGVAMYGVIIGNISTLLVKVDSFREGQRNKMENLVAYMKHHFVPEELQNDVVGFYSNFLKVNSGHQDNSSLAGLPAALKEQLEFYAHLKLINAVPMFREASMDCKKDLSDSLEPVVVGPDHTIIQFGEIGNEMYFVSHGSVEILTAEGEWLANLNPGAFFGETALIEESKRTAIVKTLSYCSLLRLEKDAFLRLLDQHKDLADHIRAISAQRQ
jgi:hypothetical protein